MPRPRQHLVNVHDTPYYHVTSRCVRRAFLCGYDRDSGKSYEHRREWLEQRIRLLSCVFAIDLCAYAVMSNHYHIVLKLVPDQARTWSDLDVVKRWRYLHKGTLLAQKFAAGEPLSAAELSTAKKTIATYKERLTSLSWFMKCLNEPLARLANLEDDCTGHFWESRFTSQALMTDQALLAGMVYVDLNPVRAGEARTPEASDHTSVKERIQPRFNIGRAVRKHFGLKNRHIRDLTEKPLARFLDQRVNFENGTPSPTVLPFRYDDYLELVDRTGRIMRSDKRGVIEAYQSPILQRLSIPESDWASYATEFEVLHRKGKFSLSM